MLHERAVEPDAAAADDQFDTVVIAASFFGYVREIIGALRRRGRRPIWFEDRPGTDTMSKALIRLAPRVMAGKSSRYFADIMEKVRHQPIRDVLVIKGESLSLESLAAFRRVLPEARFTLYLWDSYRNMPADTRQKVQGFDRAFSFDPVDAAEDRRLVYRPMFYSPEFTKTDAPVLDIGVLFIGTAHTDRYAVTQRLARALPPEIRFERVLYNPSRGLFWLKRVARPSYWRADPSQFTFTPLNRGEVSALVARSHIILDIERSAQTGFTPRTIEALASGKKLATTNPLIVEADFYRASNQFALDRHRPHISDDFLQATFEALPDDLLRRYSLDGWLDEVGFAKARGFAP